MLLALLTDIGLAADKIAFTNIVGWVCHKWWVNVKKTKQTNLCIDEANYYLVFVLNLTFCFVLNLPDFLLLVFLSAEQGNQILNSAFPHSVLPTAADSNLLSTN